MHAANKQLKPSTAIQTPSTLVDYLSQEKIYLTSAIERAKSYKDPANQTQYIHQLNDVSTLLVIIMGKTESLESFFSNEKKQEADLNQRLKQLQQLPVLSTELKVPERVAKVEGLLKANDKTMDLITDNLALADQLKVLLNDQLRALKLWSDRFKLEQKLMLIKQVKMQLKTELTQLYVQKSRPAQDKENSQEQIEYQSTLLINNQHIALIQHQLNALNLQKKTIKAELILLSTVDIKTLQSVSDIYKESVSQLSGIERDLKKLKISFDKESEILTSNASKKLIIQLQVKLKKQYDALLIQKESLLKGWDNTQGQLKKLISSRQSLAEYKINSWPIIFNKITAIPSQFYKYLKTLSLKVYDSYTWLDPVPTLIFWGLLFVSLTLFIVLNRLLNNVHENKERTRLAGYLFDGLLVLVQRNIPYICLLTMLWLVFWLTNISYSNYQLLFNLIIVWFSFRIMILIARLVLLERVSDSSGKDVTLYYRLKWLFLFGGWATAFMVLGYLLPLSLLLQDIFNRLFMLFILSVSLVIWKSKDVIPYLLRPLLIGQKRYVKNAVSLLALLVPITLFTTAIIGLFGFINLAWTMSGYQVYGLLILVGYVLIRGLTLDLLELFSEWMIGSLDNGWLWIEVFLKPLDKILRIVLLLACTMIVFQIFGWHSDSLVMINIQKIARYSIISAPGVYITVASVIEFFIVLALFVWAAKWTREFCYRWLYNNTKDDGIRNSLAVFTQYAIILLGGVITLHVLGMDLTGMSMILGGLAVGMGFGLRDFASNIVGGLMLLIERPVREGDLITLGEYEGRVAHIGIRSMRVSSWDNMEVLIPNAETFNKPFTNWTLQDGIVRTVVPIKVCRADSPLLIQQIILDVLHNTPEIVPDPPIQVLLVKIDEPLVEFEARYFINVIKDNRVEVRSKVLFAITEQFKAAGIKPPIEPLSIEIKEGQGDCSKKNAPTNNGN